MYKVIIAILVAISLTGCGLLPTKTEYSTKVLTPDDNMIMDCNITEPPSKADYAAATQKEREIILTKYINNLLNYKIVCNKRLQRVREWKVDVLKIDTKTPTTEPTTSKSWWQFGG